MECRICGAEGDHKVFKVREMMYGTGEEFSYFQCADCDCLQIAEVPPDISKYYPDDYYSYKAADTTGIATASPLRSYAIELRNKYAAFGRGFIGKYLYGKYPTKKFRGLSLLRLSKRAAILDVGCGSGSFLNKCRDIGFQNLLGIDPFNAKNIEYDNGVNILKSSIHDIGGQWDLVMFHHSFEHIPDQLVTLQRTLEILRPGGHCIIRIPTVSSYAWDHYGVNWVQLDAPRHLYLHSVMSVKVLADKTGLELSDIIFDSNAFQFWGSEQYEKNIPLRGSRSYAVNPAASSFSEDDISNFAKRAEELNAEKQGDQAIVYFRKPVK